ncbi:MAG: hypothetical protein EA364_02115 [Balneolaceae bacterium]|nr:MAG: hypothetical protein EA364_02115 [Balneolaceae bacterium]
MRNHASFILILGLLLTSCDLICSNTPEKTIHISINTLFQSFQTETDIHEFVTVVLKTRAETDDFLSQYPSDKFNEEILLNVNYADSLVVGVFVGAKPNTSYSVGIDSVITAGNSNMVYITEIGSEAGGRAIIWPAHFVVIDKADFAHRTAKFPYKRICNLEPCSWPVHTVPD